MDRANCDLSIRPIDLSDFENQERLLGALANRARLAILKVLLERGRACACELEPALGLSQPTVTLHLQKLHQAGLLSRMKTSKFVYYSVRPEYVDAVRAALSLKRLGR